MTDLFLGTALALLAGALLLSLANELAPEVPCAPVAGGCWMQKGN
jgi:hypothetical protein